MKKYVFPVTVVFGKMDHGETELKMLLTDEEAAMLEEAAKKDYYKGIYEMLEGTELLHKIHAAAVDTVTKELLWQDREEGTTYCLDAEDDPEWTADKCYPVSAHFPHELEPEEEEE